MGVAYVCPQLVVTTCGVSLLNKVASQQSRLFKKVANLQYNDLQDEEFEVLEGVSRQAEMVLRQAGLREIRELSAELNVIIGLYGLNWPRGASADVHYLLHTDTVLGELSAKILERWLAGHVGTVLACKVDGLTVRNTEEFQWGVSELVTWCEEHVEPHRGRYHVVFNLAGGFKAVHGVLNTLGMFYADELVYTFEGQSELVRIPRLPVRMDAQGTVRRYLTVLRRMRLGFDVAPHEAEGIPETMVMRSSRGISLSGWGQLIWDRTWRDIYREKLLEPPSDRVRYTDQFEAMAGKYAGTDRMELINQRIDDLARYLHTGQKLNRLDPKPLRSLTNAYEVDAWHDGDAQRIFFHYDAGNVAVLDRLGAWH